MRWNGFVQGFALIDGSGGVGLELATAAKITAEVQGLDQLLEVYSMGGGNTAILAALSAPNLQPGLFVAHDFDCENRKLLRQGKLGLVLHHDLGADITRSFQNVTAFHRRSPPLPEGGIADVQIITPANYPQY